MKKRANLVNVLTAAGLVLAIAGLAGTLIGCVISWIAGGAGFAQIVGGLPYDLFARGILSAAMGVLLIMTVKVKGVWPEMASLLVTVILTGVIALIVEEVHTAIVYNALHLDTYLHLGRWASVLQAILQSPLYLGQMVLTAAAAARLAEKKALPAPTETEGVQ